MYRQRIGHVTKEILGYAATGAIVYIALSSPRAVSGLQDYAWKESKKALSNYMRRRLREMHENGYIELQEGSIKLTKIGKELISFSEMERIEIKKHTWDHRWRCVAYDVPETLRKARNSFRNQLLQWGFVQIQKSVFVLPFLCNEEVAIAARLNGIEKYILIMEANDIPYSDKLKNRFNL